MADLRDEINRQMAANAPKCPYAPPRDADAQRLVLRDAAELLREAGAPRIQLWEDLGETIETRLERRWLGLPDQYNLRTQRFRRFGQTTGWLVDVAPRPDQHPWAQSFISVDGLWYEASMDLPNQDESDFHLDGDHRYPHDTTKIRFVMDRCVFDYHPSPPPVSFAVLEWHAKCSVDETYHPVWANDVAQLRQRVARNFSARA